jgi:hypothetical protein
LKPAEKKRMQKWFRSAVDVTIAFAVATLAKTAVAEPFYVPSGSMEPTLLVGDALLVAAAAPAVCADAAGSERRTSATTSQIARARASQKLFTGQRLKCSKVFAAAA